MAYRNTASFQQIHNKDQFDKINLKSFNNKNNMNKKKIATTLSHLKSYRY